MEYNYCPNCAKSLVVDIPALEMIPRLVCKACGFIHYRAPQILVTCIATVDNKLLWIRRATQPQAGYWSFPSGFMEEGELPEEAAARELFEETCGTVNAKDLTLFAVGSLPEINQVYLIYRGLLLNEDDISPTPEASEVGLFSREDAPWPEHAYPDLDDIVHRFYDDLATEKFGVYSCFYKHGVHHTREVLKPPLTPQ